jgi:hypothetical protein
MESEERGEGECLQLKEKDERNAASITLSLQQATAVLQI